MVPIFSPSTFAKGVLLLPTQVTEPALSEKFAASSIPRTRDFKNISIFTKKISSQCHTTLKLLHEKIQD